MELSREGPVSGSDRLVAAEPAKWYSLRHAKNTSVIISKRMAILCPAQPPLPLSLEKLINWMFSSVGRVAILPILNLDTSTSLACSGPAACSLVLDPTPTALSPCVVFCYVLRLRLWLGKPCVVRLD